MNTLFSLRFHRSPEPKSPSAAHETVATWLTEWGTFYLRNVVWKAFGSSSSEQHIFQLDFVIPPERGRSPFRYVLVEVVDDGPSEIFTAREIARRNLLRELWPGKMLTLDAHDIRTQRDIAQLRLLNALS